jgi:CarD family transcriptional regulator
MTIAAGDYVVCPGHGVGQVMTIEERPAGQAQVFDKYYIVKLVSNGGKVLVPFANTGAIRPLMRPEEVNQVFDVLSDRNVKLDRSTWNRRHREYLLKINSGSLTEVADVLRQVLLIRLGKKLSYGEKKIMDLCRELIVKEVSLTTGYQEDEVARRIDAVF